MDHIGRQIHRKEMGQGNCPTGGKQMKKQINPKILNDLLSMSGMDDEPEDDYEIKAISINDLSAYHTVCGNHKCPLGNEVTNYLKMLKVEIIYILLTRGDIASAVIHISEDYGRTFESLVYKGGNSLRADSCQMGEDWSAYESE